MGRASKTSRVHVPLARGESQETGARMSHGLFTVARHFENLRRLQGRGGRLPGLKQKAREQSDGAILSHCRSTGTRRSVQPCKALACHGSSTDTCIKQHVLTSSVLPGISTTLRAGLHILPGWVRHGTPLGQLPDQPGLLTPRRRANLSKRNFGGFFVQSWIQGCMHVWGQGC